MLGVGLAKKTTTATETFLAWDHLIGYEEVAQRLTRLAMGATLPPCLLLEGRAGLAKPAFVAGFLAGLYCDSGSACGTCGECILLRRHQHPEVYWLDPVGQAVLKREDVDALGEHLAICAGGTSVGGTRPLYRTAVIIDAERLSPQAAARLLKTLEELPRGALVLMTSSNYRQIPDTIRSRAVRVHIEPPARDQAVGIVMAALAKLGVSASGTDVEQALIRAGGAPGGAIRLLEQGAGELDLARELERLFQMSAPAAIIAMAEELGRNRSQSLATIVKEVEILLNRDYVKCLHSDPVLSGADLRALRQRREILSVLRRYAVRHKVALNTQLAVETLTGDGA